MLANYLKIGWRNLWKHKFYSIINIVGLSLGIGCGLILFQFINYHLTIDAYHKNAGSIYRVVTNLSLPDGTVEYDQGSPLALAKALKEEVPQIINQATLLGKRSFTVEVQQNSTSGLTLFSEKENVAFTDRHWFQLFDYHWEEGKPDIALNDPNSAVITRSLAEKYFGKDDAVGKIIKLDNKHEVKVTGVLSNYSANSDTKVDMFLSLSSFRGIYPDIERQINTDWSWINSSTSVYLLMNGRESADKVKAAIPSLTRKHLNQMASLYQFQLQPLKEVHFDKRYGGVIQKSMLITLGLIGVLLIVIACVNFINLAVAQSAKRTREIATRKILGSSSAGIFNQFIIETSCLTFIAALFSIIWISILLPYINHYLQLDLQFNLVQDYDLFLFLSILFAFIVISGGFYPALVLSRFKPASALKNQLDNTTTNLGFARKSLVIGQNIIAQVLIISTLIISSQVSFINSADLGFNKEEVIMIPVPDNAKSKTSSLYSQLTSHPDIKNISFCFRPPSSMSLYGGSVRFDNRPWEKFTVRSRIGDSNYLKTFELQLIAGRNLAESDTINEVLVNEQLVTKLQVENPNKIIGHQLVAGEFSERKVTIVGVFKDFHSRSLFTPIEPVLITTKRDAYDYAAVKLSGKNTAASIKNIQKAWESVYPENVFEYQFLNEQISDFYQKEELLNKLIQSSCAIAIIISSLGLLGLISLLITNRTKEIGIRKVLGASVSQLVYLLTRDFIRLVFLAFIIAVPIAWYLMNNWLQNFAYRIEIQMWMFVITGLAAIIMAITTVCFQVIKAARANPVKSLRTE